MDGWMDGWVDGWIDEWDRWVNIGDRYIGEHRTAAAAGILAVVLDDGSAVIALHGAS